MKTKFVKFSKNDEMQKWSNYFRAGDAWLSSLQILDDNRNESAWGVFYVNPWVSAFCLELFVKARISFEYIDFDGHRFSHKTTNIIRNFENEIPIFQKIYRNNNLFNLIKEFENTKDTKFGETSVSLDGNDQKKIIDTVYELRDEMCKITGLH